MKAIAEFIMGDKSHFLNSIQKVKSPLKEDNKILYTLLLAEAEENHDQKIKYLQELEQFKLCTAFAAKRLAQIFYKNNLYQEAENYAIKTFYLN